MHPATIEDSIVLAALELGNQFYRNGSLITQSENITVQQWLILLYMVGDENLPHYEERNFDPEKGLLASELADALNVTRPNITSLVNALLKKKLIKQINDSYDRRMRRLKLTKKGRDILERLDRRRHLINHRFFNDISEEEKGELLKSLHHLLARLYQIEGNGADSGEAV